MRVMFPDVPTWVWAFLLLHLAGWASVFHVLHGHRNAQATVGWTLALIFVSPLAVPFYWTFGARRYHGYRLNLQRAMASQHEAREQIFEPLCSHAVADHPNFQSLKRLTLFPLTTDNSVELLVDGDAFFPNLLSAIERAEHLILAQYYTIEDDAVGNRFVEALARKAQTGVAVYLLYDLVGSHKMHRTRMRRLRRQGVKVRPFRSPRFPSSFLHFNFRNHRKLCVIDGGLAFIGGLNIGDEYWSRHPKLSPWRDTALRITGPAVAMAQAVFLADWHWTTGEGLELNWDVTGAREGTCELSLLATGPADLRPVCSLMLLALIREANERIWIASPYLVPTESLIESLESAVRRGVEVSILTTCNPDNRISFFASWYFADRLRNAGVRIYRPPAGFMHQKVVLIDRKLGSVGTVNLDPRSLNLNFEVTALITDEVTLSRIEAMLETDLAEAHNTYQEWIQIGPLRRTLARICRLFAPLL